MGLEREIEKALGKEIPEEKTRERLLKLRKDSTAWMKFAQFVQVLNLLGWKISAFAGWSPRHYMFRNYEGQEQEFFPREDSFKAETLGELKRKHAEMKSREVDSLPDTPSEIGETIIMDVGPIEGTAYDNIHYFDRREWVGTEGATITSPRGDEQSFMLDHHDLGRGKTSVHEDFAFVSDAWGWAKQNGILNDVNAALKMEEHIPAAERTRENTGTCPVCFKNIKLESGRLVLHGYKRPGYGAVEGRCFGVNYEPLEISVEGAQDYYDTLEKEHEDVSSDLEVLQKGTSSIRLRKPLSTGETSIKPGHPLYQRQLEEAIRFQEGLLKQIASDMKFFAKVIENWQPRPLPREGERERAPGFFTKGK